MLECSSETIQGQRLFHSATGPIEFGWAGLAPIISTHFHQQRTVDRE
jgi:hypothetical protein